MKDALRRLQERNGGWTLRRKPDIERNAEIRAALAALLKEAPDGFDHSFDERLAESGFNRDKSFLRALENAKEILEAFSEGEAGAEDSKHIQQAMSYVEIELRRFSCRSRVDGRVYNGNGIEWSSDFNRRPTRLEVVRAERRREGELSELKKALLTVALRNVDEVEANAFTTLFWDADASRKSQRHKPLFR